jgi:FlaA1/EpsC-like NDP-sugar epimerase
VLADINENGLADLVRDLRSSETAIPPRFATYVLELGSLALERLLAAEGPFDYLLNVAALKHVRSERDPFSLMRMVRTNALALDDTLAMPGLAGARKVFSISTDKAANPVNLMGATKRWMERVLLHHADRLPSASVRFANVAFSAGSLPAAFLERIKKRQPLAGPSDVRRYFISHREAAELCALACFLPGNRLVYVPLLDVERHTLSFVELAERVLAFHGLEPVHCASEEEARAHPALTEAAPKVWPCYFAPSDTAGEKALEELHEPTERPESAGFRQVGAIQQPPLENPGALEVARREIERIQASPVWRKAEIVAAITLAVPELAHAEAARSLDEKM